MAATIWNTRASREDALDCYLYIAQNNPEAAERFLDALEAAFARLADMPRVGAPQEWRSARLREVRMWPIPQFSNYLIFYRERGDRIEVLRVLHGAQDVIRILLEESDLTATDD